jgi:hypothetical protein
MSVVSLVTSIVYGYRETSFRFGHGLTVMNVRIRGRPTSRKIAMVGANRRGDEAYWKTLASVRCQAFRRKSSVGLYVQVTTENEVGHLNRRKRFTSKNPPWPSLAFVEVLVFKLVSQLNVAEGVVSGQNVGISQRRHDDYTFTPGRWAVGSFGEEVVEQDTCRSPPKENYRSTITQKPLQYTDKRSLCNSTPSLTQRTTHTKTLYSRNMKSHDQGGKPVKSNFTCKFETPRGMGTMRSNF